MPKELTPPNHDNKMINTSARRNARQYALQAMYQWQISDIPLHDVEHEFVNYRIDKQIDMDYFKELIHGIPKQLTEINAAMHPFLGRSISDIDPIELAVIRISIYELLHRPDVPYRVIINEALELTKKFGSIEGYKFVNGILDKIARQARSLEIKQQQPKKPAE